MVGMDAAHPPVLFVVGTAGAGKSSLVTAFQRWSRFIETDVLAINLDPGAERVHYDAEFDVRDIISLTEVMGEYDLGPNGAQILAADLLAAQAIDVADELDGLSGDLMIVDTPGQVELFGAPGSIRSPHRDPWAGAECHHLPLRPHALPFSEWIRLPDVALLDR